jgi:hypothetical protein
MQGHWKIPKIWEGETAFILGGGASVISQFGIPQSVVQSVRKGNVPMSVYSPFMESLHDLKIIGVNSAFKIGGWMDYVYFMDKDYMLTNRGELAVYPNPVVSPLLYSEGESWCNTVKASKESGICTIPNTVAYNHNSGWGAVNLAYHLGARRIVLIGFDMKIINKKQHFHGDYINSKLVRTEESKMGFSKHLNVVPAIVKDAKRLGVEIINTSMKSAIKQFKKVPLKEFI